MPDSIIGAVYDFEKTEMSKSHKIKFSKKIYYLIHFLNCLKLHKIKIFSSLKQTKFYKIKMLFLISYQKINLIFKLLYINYKLN